MFQLDVDSVVCLSYSSDTLSMPFLPDGLFGLIVCSQAMFLVQEQLPNARLRGPYPWEHIWPDFAVLSHVASGLGRWGIRISVVIEVLSQTMLSSDSEPRCTAGLVERF